MSGNFLVPPVFDAIETVPGNDVHVLLTF